MNDAPPTFDTEILVIGAGPVGLALAGDLGWRGRQCILVEKGDGSIYQPKMDLVGIRTMEFCRRWGIVGDVEATPYDRDYPQDNVYLTALNGYELGRQPMPSMRAEQPPPESPQKRERSPQNMFDPVLQRFVARQPGVATWYRHELVAFNTDEHGVTATIRNLETQQTRHVRARYLVGCDGGRSLVRETLGIGMQGKGVLTHTTNVIFRCPEFNQLHDKAPGYRYMFVGPEGTYCTIVAINGKDQWRMSIIGGTEQRQYTDDELRAHAYRAMGKPFELEILSTLAWTRAELVADAYHQGRVFIAGDACHLTSPTGGLGMNTGIGDAVDLSWKLAAQIEGWGGPALLESYVIERRPVAKRITQFSTGNLKIMKQVPTSPHIADDSPDGEAARAAAGKALSEGLKREWFSLNMHLGNRYVYSPICVYDEPEDHAAFQAEFNEAIHYRPSTRPGCRAPHVWLANGQSTLDWYGRGFVLVAAQDHASAELKAFQTAALEQGIPLKLIVCQEPDVRQAYDHRWVLVRPDGHVAWRGNNLPQDPERVLTVVSGHGPNTTPEALDFLNQLEMTH